MLNLTPFIFKPSIMSADKKAPGVLIIPVSKDLGVVVPVEVSLVERQREATGQVIYEDKARTASVGYTRQYAANYDRVFGSKQGVGSN